MPSPPHLSLVLPAYNEAESIGRTLSALRRYLDAQGFAYQVIVAADGDDNTPEVVAKIARDWPALQLTAERGRHGKGSGLRRGMALATGDVVGFLDADYKTAIEESEKLIPWLSRGYDVVIGSRAMGESRIERAQPWYRQIGSKAFAVVMHSIVGLWHVRDTQCGFKFFTRDTAREIFRRSRVAGYMCDVEILWIAERLGYRIKEVGIRWKDDGDTRLALVSGNIQNARELVRIRRFPYDFRVVPETSPAREEVVPAETA